MKLGEYPYILSIETNNDGNKVYFVAFIDGSNKNQKTEIAFSVFLGLSEERRILQNICRSDERNIEHNEVSEETLNTRAQHPLQTVEEQVLSSELSCVLYMAIDELPETQRHRFILYYEIGLTYVQIAKMEGCSARAVEYSVNIAKEKIKKKF